MSTSTSLIGKIIGKTEIRELIGRGGSMAAVYKGFQPDLGRYVAVKVIPQSLEQLPGFIERFKLEARTIAQLQHPYILPLHDYGEQDGLLYLVMAYVSGGSLTEEIAKGALSFERTRRIVQQMTSALDYAHRQGVIHRDIKPGNILVDQDGNALLADFGIVKVTGNDKPNVDLTAPSGIVGTPAYMSPE